MPFTVKSSRTQCLVETCDRPGPFVRDLCSFHYRRLCQHNQEMIDLVPSYVLKFCKKEDCDRPLSSNGLCDMHWKRWVKYGDADHRARAAKDQGDWVLQPNGYMRANRPSHPNSSRTGQISQHTYVMSKHLGRPLTPNESIHHKNGIRHDNRLENLELWSSKTHKPGQRVTDMVEFARSILDQYEHDYAKLA